MSCELKIYPLETYELYSKDEISPSGVEVCVSLHFPARGGPRENPKKPPQEDFCVL